MRAPVGHVPRQASQARAAELLPPLLLFHIPQERHPGWGGVATAPFPVVPPPGGLGPGQQAAIWRLACRNAALHPEKRREPQPSSGTR